MRYKKQKKQQQQQQQKIAYFVRTFGVNTGLL